MNSSTHTKKIKICIKGNYFFLKEPYNQKSINNSYMKTCKLKLFFLE